MDKKLKRLQEGPGAGYNVRGWLGFDDDATVTVENVRHLKYGDCIADVTVSRGDFSDIEIEGYDWGGSVEDQVVTDIILKDMGISMSEGNSGIYTAQSGDLLDMYDEVDEVDELEEYDFDYFFNNRMDLVINQLKTKIRGNGVQVDTVYGSGYSYSSLNSDTDPSVDLSSRYTVYTCDGDFSGNNLVFNCPGLGAAVDDIHDNRYDDDYEEYEESTKGKNTKKHLKEGTGNYWQKCDDFPIVVCELDSYFARCNKEGCDGFVFDPGEGCDECGATMTEGEFNASSEYDYDASSLAYESMSQDFESLKKKLSHGTDICYNIQLESGYYSGAQIIIEDNTKDYWSDIVDYAIGEFFDEAPDYWEDWLGPAIAEGKLEPYYKPELVLDFLEERGVKGNFDMLDGDDLFDLLDVQYIDEVWAPYVEEYIERAKAEVNAFIDTCCEKLGFVKLGVAARFSSGETVYRKLGESKTDSKNQLSKELDRALNLANKEIQKTLDYLEDNSQVFDMYDLKLHDVQSYMWSKMEKEFPDIDEDEADRLFGLFCQDNYEFFTDEYDFDDYRVGVGRTSSFFLQEYIDQSNEGDFVEVVANLVNDYIGSSISFGYDKRGLIELGEWEYENEESTIEDLNLIAEHLLGEAKIFLEDRVEIADYIISFKKNQVKYFKEYVKEYVGFQLENN